MCTSVCLVYRALQHFCNFEAIFEFKVKNCIAEAKCICNEQIITNDLWKHRAIQGEYVVWLGHVTTPVMGHGE